MYVPSELQQNRIEFTGKTCLVRRFTQGVFPPGQGATIGVDFMIKTVVVDNEKIKVSYTKKNINEFKIQWFSVVYFSFKYGIRLVKKDFDQ